MDIKSRKLLVTAVSFVTATAFVFLGHADFAGWSDFMQWAIAAYVAGNVGEHFSGSKKK